MSSWVMVTFEDCENANVQSFDRSDFNHSDKVLMIVTWIKIETSCLAKQLECSYRAQKGGPPAISLF